MNYRQKPGLSGTQLVKLAKSPAHYKESVTNPTEPTPAMEFGTACHTMVLEPSEFGKRYAVFKGEGTRASKEYKEFALANGSKEILKSDEYERILGMVTALERHKLARELVLHGNGANEFELYWTEDGVQCKGKLDRYLAGARVIVDYKTANDASEAAFNAYKARSLGYYLQAAHYQAGVKHSQRLDYVPAFVFVVQETEAPYAIKVYELDQQSIDAAHEQRTGLLQTYAQCMASGVWPGYSEEIGRL